MKRLTLLFIFIGCYFTNLAQSTEKKTGQYTTTYLFNGEKIKTKEGQMRITMGHQDELQFSLPSGNKSIKKRDIDHSITTDYSLSGKINWKMYVIYVQDGKELLNLNVILKTSNYYLTCYYYASALGYAVKCEYKIVDADRKIVAKFKTAEEAKTIIPQYFGELTQFITFLEKNEWELKKCDQSLFKVGAFLYATEFYKEEKINDDNGSKCVLKLLKTESGDQ